MYFELIAKRLMCSAGHELALYKIRRLYDLQGDDRWDLPVISETDDVLVEARTRVNACNLTMWLV